MYKEIMKRPAGSNAVTVPVMLTFGSNEGMLRLNRGAMKKIGNPKAVRVFHDQHNRKVAVHPSNDPSAFKVHGTNGTLACAGLCEEVLPRLPRSAKGRLVGKSFKSKTKIVFTY